MRKDILEPRIDRRIDNEMNTVGVTTVRDGVRVAEAEIPTFAFIHHDALSVQEEFNVGTRDHGDMQPRLASLK